MAPDVDRFLAVLTVQETGLSAEFAISEQKITHTTNGKDTLVSQSISQPSFGKSFI